MDSSGMMSPADPASQVITLLRPLPNGTVEPIPVPVPIIDLYYGSAISSSITYAVQIGASAVMLLVVLGMTPLHRLISSTAARVNVASLTLCVVRCTLLALFFPSSYLKFYALFSDDNAVINPSDTRVSIVATLCAVLQSLLVQWALCIQAWSMVQLWRAVPKAVGVFLSLVLALLALGFKAASSSLQIRAIASNVPTGPADWVRRGDLVCSAMDVVWFCALFVARLAYHMWRHRSMLPSARGASAMEVLVMTNGILMVVPVIFAGLQFNHSFQNFEPASLVLTSVVIILPLGTLVAARIATTSNGASAATPGGRRNHYNGGGGGNNTNTTVGGTGKRNPHGSATSRGVTLVSSGGRSGVTTSSSSAAAQQHVKDKSSWSHDSVASLNRNNNSNINNTSTAAGRDGGDDNDDSAVYAGTARPSAYAWGNSGGGVAAVDHHDIMLRDIDHADEDGADLEKGLRGRNNGGGAGIRVQREFGSRVDRR